MVYEAASEQSEAAFLVLFLRGAKTIALSTYGFDVMYSRAKPIQLLPYPGHAHMNVMQALVDGGAPDLVVKLFVREDLPWIFGQEGQ